MVLIANTFHGVKGKVEFTKQAHQSLRPNGRFIIVNWRALSKEETTVDGTARGPPEELRMSVSETHEIMAETFEDIQEIGRVAKSPRVCLQGCTEAFTPLPTTVLQ